MPPRKVLTEMEYIGAKFAGPNTARQQFLGTAVANPTGDRGIAQANNLPARPAQQAGDVDAPTADAPAAVASASENNGRDNAAVDAAGAGETTNDAAVASAAASHEIVDQGELFAINNQGQISHPVWSVAAAPLGSIDVNALLDSLRALPNDEIALTYAQVNHIKKADTCNLILLAVPVAVGGVTRIINLALNVDTGLLYIPKGNAFGRAVGLISALFPHAAQQYEEAMTVRNEWMDDVTGIFEPAPEDKKTTPKFFRQPGETWRLVNPGEARSIKVELGKPSDAPLTLLFYCLENPKRIFVAVYTGIPSLTWNKQKDIDKIKKWRGQQIKRVTLQAFRFGDEADQEWTIAEQNYLFERVRRAFDCGAILGMTIKEVLDRMNWRLLHIDIDAAFDHEQPRYAPLALEECDAPAPGAQAKRKVLSKKRVAFAKPVSAVQNCTLACLPKIKTWKLKPDTSGFDYSRYILPAEQEADAPAAPDDDEGDQDESDEYDQPSPSASKRGQRATGGNGGKSTTKAKSPAKSSKASGKRPAVDDDDDDEPVAPVSKRRKATPGSKAPESASKGNPSKTTKAKKDLSEAVISWSDYESADEECTPSPTGRSRRAIRPARVSTPAARVVGQNLPACAAPSRPFRASTTPKKSPAGKGKAPRSRD